MKRGNNTRLSTLLLLLAALLAPSMPDTTAAHGLLRAATTAPQSNNIHVNGFFSVDPAQQGSTFLAAIVLDIPDGMHVNSNRPLGKYAVPTVIKVESPRGLKVTPLTYPRATVRTFRFGEGAPEERLAVYEGRAIARFSVNVPANYEMGVARIRVSVRFQSCNDEVCFPPATRELVLPIAIVGRDTPANRINDRYFGSSKPGKRG